MLTISEIMLRARSMEVAIPAFNVPYLPMTEPVVQAVLDQKAFALIETARPEWIRFESYGPAAVAAEFARWGKPEAVRLHLDHVPVIDEDFHQVDYPAHHPGSAELRVRIGYDRWFAPGAR